MLLTNKYNKCNFNLNIKIKESGIRLFEYQCSLDMHVCDRIIIATDNLNIFSHSTFAF